MNKLILQSTSLAQWYTLVSEAENAFGKRLAIDLESYLVYLLEHYTNKPDLTGSILALDYLHSLEATGRARTDKLRDIGDKCLLFSGFFPEVAFKRHVTVSYFVSLGRHAYNHLSSRGLVNKALYSLLREQFVNLLDLLFSIRELSGEQHALSLMQAEELWRNTGSQYALQLLKRHDKNLIATKTTTIQKIH